MKYLAVTNFSQNLSRRLMPLAALFLAAVSVPTLEAQVEIAGAPVIGSSNTVSVEPPVSRPGTHTCTVQLFTNQEFADFNTKSFTYTPPAHCAGPWAKVIFEADFTVTKGLQYDRTAQFFLGGANIYYGTTPEPRSNLSPAWHVERDVTELSSLLTTSQPGSAILGNYVGIYNGVDYNGIIYANAKLVFYLTDAINVAPTVPTAVIGLPGNGGAATLNTSASVYTQKVSLPTNVTKAYLDVIAQGQSTDEFWYFNVPNNLTTVLENYGGTAFRETEITIDGTAAGTAPVYPWIFTGGIDPLLWEPLPGFQTLNFKPFRVDLTPFAGQLSDGKTHTLGLRVYNADSYFLIAANLLLYTDPILTKVTGHVTQNTLAASPTAKIINNIKTDGNGDAYGSLEITSARTYAITGDVTTSNGVQTTTVEAATSFTNTQYFTLNADYLQNAVQLTTYKGNTYTTVGGVNSHEAVIYEYPFSIDYAFVGNPDGTYTQNTVANQQYVYTDTQWADGQQQYASNTTYTGNAQDTLSYDANFDITGFSNNKSTEKYVTSDSNGNCYDKTMTAANVKLASVVSSTTCGN